MGLKSKIPRLILSAILLLALTGMNGQDPTDRHRLGAGFGFTFIPVAKNLYESDASGLFVPSLRLDYYFHLSTRWALGFMGNYELDHYMISEEGVERDHALGLTLVGMFKITQHLGVYTGGGVELEPNQNFGIFKLGLEYTIDLKKNWALVPKLHFDFKQNYDTWSFSLSLAKYF